jgi:hypothetical protein
MPESCWRWVVIAAVIGLAIGAGRPAAANMGDRQGWSYLVDQQRRTLLIYAAAKDGPRSLTMACQHETFEILLEDVGNVRTAVTGSILTLANGAARYEAKGEIGFFASTKSFDSNTIADAGTLRRIRDTLVPVLEGPGPLVLTLGSLKRELPVAGLAEPLKRFKTACFDSRHDDEVPARERPRRRR